MANPFRECVFCGGIPLTEEDILPRWLRRQLASGWLYQPEFEKSPRKPTPWRVNLPTFKVKAVCVTCNGGWMRTLQNEAKPWLEQMIWGNSVELPPIGQGTVASWAAMTTTMMLVKSEATPRESARSHLRVHHEPPPGSYVGLSHFQSFDVPRVHIHPRGLTRPAQQEGEDRKVGFVCALVIIEFVVLVVVPAVEFVPINVPWPVDADRQFVIWPPYIAPTRWPPRLRVNEEDVARMVLAFASVGRRL
jgi:hypothetical protein